MKTFICNNCQTQVRRPTAPLKCDACGAQRIGLFRVAPAGAAPAPPPPPTVVPPRPPEAPLPPLAPPRPASPPAAPAYLPPTPAPSPPVAPPAAVPVPAPPPVAAPSVPPPVSSAPAALTEEAGPTLDDAQPPTTAWKRPTGRLPTSTPSEPSAPAVSPPPEAPPPRSAPPAAPPERARPAPSKVADAPAAKAPAAPPSDRPKPVASERRDAREEPAPTTPAQPVRTHEQVEPGTIVWKHPSGGDRTVRQPLRNCPAVGSDGRIYAALGRHLVALSERDGGIYRLWEYDARAHIPGSPALGSDGRLRIHSGDGKLHCVNLSGEASWEPVAVGEPLGWASPVVDAEGHTYICSYSGGLLRIDAQGSPSRNLYWQTRQKFDSTPLIRQNVLYVGSEDGFVYAIAIDGARGRLAWDPLVDQGKTGWFVNSAPAPLPDGGLIVAGRDEHLYCFQASGAVAWKTHIRGQMLASPVIGLEGEIYVGVSLERRGDQSKGRLVCIDPKSRRSRWDFEVSRPVESTPAIGADGVVYFGDNSGTIHAITSEGRRLWHQNVGSPVRSAGTIAGKRRLVFGLDSGQLLGLECASSELAAKGWPKYMGTLEQSGATRKG